MVLSSQPSLLQQRASKASMKSPVCMLKESAPPHNFGNIRFKNVLLNHRCNLNSTSVYERLSDRVCLCYMRVVVPRDVKDANAQIR